MPYWAKDTARLAAVVVLPSPGEALVTTIVRKACTDCEKIRLVRSVLYASALAERTSASVTKSGFIALDALPLPARRGSARAMMRLALLPCARRGMTASPGT